ncbi:HAD-IIB family hydrolase [Salinisphaera sp. T31B1]|uniref:HAD-IIB family hydrolase n=1 Tax=Salinisphaera sp. T31B1 TaxID=727963 RepID=UPI0033405FAF
MNRTKPAQTVGHHRRRVIFTDLDATLLDHHDYGWGAAAPALAELGRRNVPVCLVTSKTAAEVAALRIALDNGHPFAVENGGAVAVPEGYFDGAVCDARTPVELTTLGAGHDELRALARRLRAAYGFRFTGFGDMDTAAVARATGLDAAAAERARRREASEPLLWQDSADALDHFTARVAEAGYAVRVGGRFVHVLGHADKGGALAWLRARYAAVHGSILAIALGDSGNDADMLAAADIGYWVARPDGSYYAPAGGPIRHAPGIGPAGWAAAIDALIEGEELPEDVHG